MSLKQSFELTNEGELQDYLGTQLTKYPVSWIELQQKKMIDNCLDMLGMGPSSKNVKTHDTPAESSKIHHVDEDGANWKHAWNYQAVMGCLNYLQAMTRPDLAYSVHQCAHFCNNPKLLHEQGLKRFCCYLYLTRDCSLVFKPNLTDGFKCYVDDDWAGTWLKSCPSDKTGALSRTGYLITYANCPIMWGSKMQLFVALSTTEAKLIAMSTMLREVIHLQNLLLELRGCNFPIPFTKPQVVCCTFEDCIKVAQSDHKICPRTKQISVCLFNFCDHVKKGIITSLPIFLQNLCPVINTCTYVIKLWGGCQLHLLTMRKCEVMWDHHLNNVSQLPFPSSYSTSNCFHLSFVYFS